MINQIPNEKTLITPVQCKNVWRQFKSETEFTVTQAISAQVYQIFCCYIAFLVQTNLERESVLLFYLYLVTEVGLFHEHCGRNLLCNFLAKSIIRFVAIQDIGMLSTRETENFALTLSCVTE